MATQQKAVDLAREGLGIAKVSYENGVITAAELNDARLSLLETEWELMQAKYAQIAAAARTRFAAGLQARRPSFAQATEARRHGDSKEVT